ncbi:MAG: branched-chain amino acid ABC transporter permease [Alphaproteobacteria bacterium]|nr:branched-chain amino acid ABC transporter permease [Alphaproteobacteria bacterium]
MELFLQILINSVIVASIYGVMAMSFTLAYRGTRFFNMAHGAMGAVGGYMFFFLHQNLSWPFLACVFGGVVAAGLTGLLTDRLVFMPQRKRGASGAVLLVVSLGILAVIEAVIAMIFSSSFQPLAPMGEITSYQIGPARISEIQTWMVMTNLLVFAGMLFLLYETKFGRLLRAISDDQEVARILGIRTNLLIGWMFFISAALAGLMGILVGLDTGVEPTMGFYLLLKGVIAAIIGGISGVPGAFVGGFFLAFSENLGVWALGGAWRDAIAFILLLGFLLFRPQGILGSREG